MLFKGKRQICDGVKMNIDGKTISLVSDIKSLGIYIDENLTWKSHIQNNSKTVSRATGIFIKWTEFYILIH